jgi:hypothetical protein
MAKRDAEQFAQAQTWCAGEVRTMTAARPEMISMGEIEWLKDDRGADWFVVPDANRLLVANDRGQFCHAITWFEFLIGWESNSDRYGPTNHDITHWHPDWQYGRAPIGDVLAVGAKLFELLSNNGCPTWSTDSTRIQEWMHTRVFTIRMNGELVLEGELERESRWKAMYSKPRRSQEVLRAEREAKAVKKKAWEDAGERRKEWLASPVFNDMFVIVYGKRYTELNASDHKVVVQYARKVAEYRLGLCGVQAPQPLKY